MRWSFKLNNIRLRNKFLMLYIFCVLIPIVITNVSFYNVTSNNVRDQRMQDISRALEQIKNEFRMKIEDAVSISTVLLPDYSLNLYLDKDYEHPTVYVAEYDAYVRRMLSGYMPVYTTVHNIRIYVDNPSLLHSGAVGYLTDEVKQSVWYQALEHTASGNPVIVRTYRENLLTAEESSVFDTFSIVRKMEYYKDMSNYEKILKIELRMPVIQQVFNNLNLNGHVYLINDQGTIEYTTDPNVYWAYGNVKFDSLDLSKDVIKFETEYENMHLLEGWKLIGAIAEDEVYLEVHKSREYVMWMALINLAFSTIIILWITRSMNIRLVNILRHMKRVKNQRFETIKELESTDEIGQLTSEFNRMTLQIKSLIDDVYKADIQKKNLEIERRKAQLNALQSQINPHFLFNALEAIRMRILIQEETETANIIQNMAKLFRSSLTWNKDWIMVKEEIEFMSCFLEIQQYRFGERLQYEIDVDVDTRYLMIPKMAFLPFVENASIHGIEPMKNGGRIHIQFRRYGDELMFSIRDNGIGMSEEQVRKIYSFLEIDVELGERIGIQNSIYRLKMIYGDKLKLNINSALGQGTHVRISVPVRYESDESQLKLLDS